MKITNHLREEFITENMRDFVVENGVLTEYRGLGGEVAIPAGVTEIASDAFQGCGELTTIHAPAKSCAEQYAKMYGIKFEAI